MNPITNVKLVDLGQAHKNIRNAFEYIIDEPNGNPWYYPWRFGEDSYRYKSDVKFQKHKDSADAWLRSLGLTDNDVILITYGW